MAFQVYGNRHSGWSDTYTGDIGQLGSTLKDYGHEVADNLAQGTVDAIKGVSDKTTFHGKLIHDVVDEAQAQYKNRIHGRKVDGDRASGIDRDGERMSREETIKDMDAMVKEYDDMLLSLGEQPHGHISNVERKKIIDSGFVPKIEDVQTKMEETELVRLVQQAHANSLMSRNKLFATF